MLLGFEFKRARRRRDSLAFPSPRGRLYYCFVGKYKHKLLEGEAYRGDVSAQAALASTLLFGAYGKHDTRESLIWTAKALAAGSCHAKFLYGYRHWQALLAALLLVMFRY